MTDEDHRALADAVLKMLYDAGADYFEAISTLAMALAAVIGAEAGDYDQIARMAEHCGREIACMAQVQAGPVQ